MRMVLVLLSLAGCASLPKPLPTLTEDEVRARAHALLAAYDAADEAVFVAALGDTFALWEDKELKPPDALLAKLRDRRTRGAPRVLRSYASEQVRISADVGVYIGESTEHAAAEPGRPARDYEGIDTLVFARDRSGSLRAVHWAWERAGKEGTRELWNDTYLDPAVVTTAPNHLLIEAVQDVAPGSALDLGVGQGRNALYLASRGWEVTGVDISDVGLGLARDEAAKQKVALTLVHADLDTWDLGVSRWDLVTMIYMGSDEAMVRRVQASLKPGGLFVLSGFAPENAGGPDSAAGGKLAGYFAEGFEVLRDEVAEGIADWGQRKARLIHFVARKQVTSR
ncbi:MAG: class I SAM-dependent methyltransferase [Polyangiales bacterium]